VISRKKSSDNTDADRINMLAR